MDMVTIKDGKFYKENQVMPFVFGNIEQIQALNRITKHSVSLKEGLVLNCHLEVIYKADFICFCGRRIFLEDSSEDEDDVQILAGKIHKCSCKKHQFKTYMDKGHLMVTEI